MKKTILLLTIIPLISFGQIYTNQASGDYSFQSSSSAFTYLSNPTTVLKNWGNTTKNYTIALPFTFPQRSQFTAARSIIVSTEGRIEFHPGMSFPRTDRTLLITKFAGNSILCDRKMFGSNQISEISYSIDSSQLQNKIFKLEFKNMGVWNGDSQKVVNAQVWLYENGTIELRFGKQNLGNEDMLKIFGIVYDNDISLNSSSLMLKGNPLTPSTVVNTSDYGIASNLSNENMVYQFIRNQTYTSVPNLTNTPLHVYPNPASNRIHFSISEHESIHDISLYNSNGTRIDTYYFNKENNDITLTIDNILNGTYYLHVETDRTKYITHFIKK